MAYATTADVKTYLGISATTDDALLTALIAEAQEMIDRAAGQTFEASTNTTRYFDAIKDVDGLTLVLDKPLASINSVTNGDGVAVTSGQYVTEPRNDTPYWAIRLKNSAGVSWTYGDDPENAIQVSGKWAYSTSAPQAVARLCISAAAALYRLRENPVAETIVIDGRSFTTPKDVAAFAKQRINDLGLVRTV